GGRDAAPAGRAQRLRRRHRRALPRTSAARREPSRRACADRGGDLRGDRDDTAPRPLRAGPRRRAGRIAVADPPLHAAAGVAPGRCSRARRAGCAAESTGHKRTGGALRTPPVLVSSVCPINPRGDGPSLKAYVTHTTHQSCEATLFKV